MLNFYQTHINEITVILACAISLGMMLIPMTMYKDGKPTFLAMCLSIFNAAALFTMLKILPEGTPWVRSSTIVILLIIYILVRLDVYIVSRSSNTVKMSDDDYPKYSIMSIIIQSSMDIGFAFMLVEVATMIFEAYHH